MTQVQKKENYTKRLNDILNENIKTLRVRSLKELLIDLKNEEGKKVLQKISAEYYLLFTISYYYQNSQKYHQKILHRSWYHIHTHIVIIGSKKIQFSEIF